MCVDDILTKATIAKTTRKKILLKSVTIEKTTNTDKEKETDDILALHTENDIHLLDEITGEVIENASVNIEYHMTSISTGNLNCRKPEILSQFPSLISNPNRLDVLCIKFINMHLVAYDTKPLPSDVCIFNRSLKSDNQNRPFIAIDQNDLPKCLRHKTNSLLKPNVIITSDVKLTAENKNYNKQLPKVGTEALQQSALQMKIIAHKVAKNYVHSSTQETMRTNVNTAYEKNKRKHTSGSTERKIIIKKKVITKLKNEKRTVKRKKLKSYWETSSENSDFLDIVDTDNSDNETFDEYIATCIREIEDKENLDPDNVTIPFGFSDVSYFTSDADLKEND